ncbi:MAG TPA: NAD(P)H-binding protein [Polyangiaceae bacterium]|nr:NAD(P)H-binding protein [Polyangiaceae bacterium]
MTLRYVVTGAFGYSGQYITRALLDRGYAVTTLTNSPKRDCDFADRVRVAPLAFHSPDELTNGLRGAKVLINTYWVRFDHATFTHLQAVENTRKLFRAARDAGVQRIVHVSITHPSKDSPLPYFEGKARLEAVLHDTGIPYSILRPAVLFGGRDILINNIAWTLRRFPVFGILGDGQYGIRPIHVVDLARLAVDESEREGQRIIDAVGPESFTFRELVVTLARVIGRPRPIISIPPMVGLLVAKLVGLYQRDVFLTKEEIMGLMAGHLASDAPSTGTIKLTEWASSNADALGKHYASELRRRRDRDTSYDRL